MIAATNSWILAFDNLSSVSITLSDALCRLATGGGFRPASLHEHRGDDPRGAAADHSQRHRRDATRGDLLDRTLRVEFAPIPETRRRTAKSSGPPSTTPSQESRRAPRRRRGRPARRRDRHTPHRPADGRLRHLGLGRFPGTRLVGDEFRGAYARNRGDAHISAVEASPVGPALLRIGLSPGGFAGTATELLKRLTEAAGDGAVRQKGWPGNPQALSVILERLQPDLRGFGVQVVRDRTSSSRLITLEPATTDAESLDPDDADDADDADDGPAADEAPVPDGGGKPPLPRPTRFQQLREQFSADESKEPRTGRDPRGRDGDAGNAPEAAAFQ